MNDMRALNRKQWTGLTIVWMMTILVLSLMPVRIQEPALWKEVLFNSCHVPMYAVLTFCLVRTYSRKVFFYSFLTAFLYGVLMEVLQGFTSYRSPELLDVMSNTAGILAVLAWMKRKGFVEED